MRRRASLVCFAALVALALQQQRCPSQPSASRPPVVALLVVNTDTLPHATLGEAYTTQLAGGALPPRLTLHATGIISGIPKVAGNYDRTAQVEDAGRIALATRTIASIHFIGARTPHVRAGPGTAGSLHLRPSPTPPGAHPNKALPRVSYSHAPNPLPPGLKSALQTCLELQTA